MKIEEKGVHNIKHMAYCIFVPHFELVLRILLILSVATFLHRKLKSFGMWLIIVNSIQWISYICLLSCSICCWSWKTFYSMSSIWSWDGCCVCFGQTKLIFIECNQTSCISKSEKKRKQANNIKSINKASMVLEWNEGNKMQNMEIFVW